MTKGAMNMKLLKPKIIVTVIAIFFLTAAVVIASPGSGDDPLVTLSYITDEVIPEIKAYIDEKLSDAPSSETKPAASSDFNLVNVKANHKIIGDEGTQFVLRMGTGTIVATENGGVADLTAGIDLKHGTPIPANHNLLAPKDDSRGVHMETDGIILIKGTYTVIPD